MDEGIKGAMLWSDLSMTPIGGWPDFLQTAHTTLRQADGDLPPLLRGQAAHAPENQKRVSSTNLGDNLQEVLVLTEEEAWRTDKATNRPIYHSKNCIPTGGRAGNESEDAEVDEEDATVEEQAPARSSTCTPSPASSTWPQGQEPGQKAAMDAGIHDFGVALTLKHQRELSNHLVE